MTEKNHTKCEQIFKCTEKTLLSSLENGMFNGIGVTVQKILKIEIWKTAVSAKKTPEFYILKGWHLPYGSSDLNNL